MVVNFGEQVRLMPLLDQAFNIFLERIQNQISYPNDGSIFGEQVRLIQMAEEHLRHQTATVAEGRDNATKTFT